MSLSKMNKDVAVYNFGSEKERMDGIIRINIKDINESEIEKMPSDGTVNRGYAYKALAKLTRLAFNKEFPDKVHFVS